MYFTTKTNTGVYLFLCARWTHYQADANRNLRWSASKPRPNRVILVHPTPQLFSFFLVNQKPFLHTPLVLAHDLAACKSVYPNKPNKIQDITTNKQKYRQTTIYALSCGEKLSPKVHLWRKNDKYQVCCKIWDFIRQLKWVCIWVWRGVRSDAQLSCTETRFQKWC